MDQPESMEVDSVQDGTSETEEKQKQNKEEAPNTSSKPQEIPVHDIDSESSVPQKDTHDSTVMEQDEHDGKTSEVQKESAGEELSNAERNEQCEKSSPNMAVVIVDDEFPQLEILDVEESISDQQCNETDVSQSQDGGSDELENPLNASSEEESAGKGGPESDALEIIGVEMPSVEKSGIVVICSASETKENSNSSEKESDECVTLSVVEGSEKANKEQKDSSSSGEAQAGQQSVDSDMTKLDDSEDIVELPVHKEPAVLVDLANEDESVGNNQRKKSRNQNFASEACLIEDQTANNKGKRIKLRSLASLVDGNNKEDVPVTNSVTSTSHPDIPGIGEIVEHGVIIGSDEVDGLQLRISNVVGGEDCITGLTVDEDRDSLSSIQISSVTTLIDPISPEDPNQASDGEVPKVGEGGEKEAVKGTVGSTSDFAAETQTSGSEAGVDGGVVVLSKEGGQNSSENEKCSSAKAGKSSDGEDSHTSESASPKIRLSSAVSEVAKDTGKTGESDATRHVYHILRSVLTVKRNCIVCYKVVRCEFRVVKKYTSGTWGFLCSAPCRSKWTADLTDNHAVEKPRLIFEKLCGMCGKDLSDQPRDGQYSWETREFCSKDCLTHHLNEVAAKCHLCSDAVRPMFIGKYCVRFGSDIHQFCSNTCLECYKTKIKVCCYCQKNLETVQKVTSASNKEYCSAKCLRRAQRRDVGQQNHSDKLPCTVCQSVNLNRYEFVANQESYQLCSDPCLNVYKYANKVKAVPCCLCFRVMNAEDVAHYLYHGGHQLRVFCSDSCVNVFILSARKIVICEACKVKKYNFDMIHQQVDEDFRNYFYCSLSCLNLKDSGLGQKNKNTVGSSVKNGTVTSSSSSDPPVTTCNMCSAMAKAQYHMVMSDNTLRSFCRYGCASKYKSTFGFQVNGIQRTDSPETTNPVIREKPPPKTSVSQPEDTDNVTSQIKKKTADSVEDISSQVTAELLRLLTPPTMVNKATSCRPSTLTKGVYCKPHPWHRQTQTKSSNINCNLYTSEPPPILPVPVPVYVPAPMMMYNMPCPVPVFVPIPLPVPIFIPTTAKTTADISKMMTKIQDEMPEDPFEAEMLLLARASSESVVTEALAREAQENPSTASDCGSHSELKDIDVSCLDTLEEDVPRFTIKSVDGHNVLDRSSVPDDGNSEDEDEGENSKKRKLSDEEGSQKKRVRVAGSGESLPSSSHEEESQPASLGFTTEALTEEYPGPFLNKMYGLAAWKKWVTAKNAELAKVSSSRNMKMICDDLLSMNCEDLNYALCLFLKDLRKNSGESYEPDTVYYLLLGIQQHLFDSARTDCIFMDFGFEKFTNSFDEITKTFLKQPQASGEECVSKVGVTRITETMLWECRQLGAHTPQVLLNTLFYFNTKVFKLKTVEEHQALSFPKIIKQWRRKDTRTGNSVMGLLKYFARTKDGNKRKKLEMFENRDDPLRCPVKLYEFYLSKCPESLRTQPGIYYVYPERACVPDSPTWFSNQAVQPVSLSKMLHRTLLVKEVQEALRE